MFHGSRFTRTFIAPFVLMLSVAAAVLAMTAAAQPASAYVGESKTLPSTSFASGSVKVTGYAPSGTATWTYKGGGRCVYIQAKHTSIWGKDGGWDRLTSDNCGGTRSVSWSKSTSAAYNGIKFRLCQNVNNGLDNCGGDVNIGY